jgi:amidase
VVETAVSLLERLRARELSAVELLDAHLADVERLNPEYNIVVAQDRDRARAEARAVDEARARGDELGALAGLPMTIKDSIEVTGMRTTCGVTWLRDHVPERDADSVTLLRNAGAVIYGKTNLATFAADWQSYNDVYGLTRNPWNPERTVGGSSGGSAAAVAAGLAPLELGTDIGGSIRVPSHFCGVYGHKPSYGAVPLRGHIPPPPGGLYEVPLGVMGPLARSGKDLSLELDVLTRSQTRDERDLSDLRIGTFFGYTVDDAYRRELESFIADLGVETTPVELPIDKDEAYDTYLRTLFGIVGAFTPDGAEGMSELAAGDDTGYAARLGAAMGMTLREWFEAQERREHFFVAWARFFEEFDLLLCPAAATVAFPHDMSEGDGEHSTQLDRRLPVSGGQAPYFDNFMWPSIALCSNLPATVLPTGRFVDGLPCGLQAIGRFGGDRTTLRFAELVGQYVSPKPKG